MIKTTYAFTLFLLLFLFNSRAHSQDLIHTIFFESGSYFISENEMTKLSEEIKRIECEKFQLKLFAHADSLGDVQSNQILSDNRLEAVFNVLVDKFQLPENEVVKQSYGEQNPQQSSDLSLNRKVDIIIYCIPPIIVTTTTQEEPFEKPVNDIEELYALLVDSAETFKINPKIDNFLKCKDGAQVFIPSNTFSISEDAQNDSVNFKIKVCSNYSDMIANNLTTMTSQNEVLATLGMVHTEAQDEVGTSLAIQNNKEIKIMMPSKKKAYDAFLFDGNHQKKKGITWKKNKTPIYDVEALEYLTCQVDYIQRSRACNAFWCRITDKLFPKTKLRRLYVQVRNHCDYRDGFSEEDRKAIQAAEINKVLQKYGVSNIQSLYEKIEAQKVASIEEEFGLNGFDKGSTNDYIMSLTNLGWANCDIYDRLKGGPKQDILVNLKPASNIDCKIIYKNENIIMPVLKSSKDYRLVDIPARNAFSIMILKYEDKKAYAYFDEITVQKDQPAITPQFTELTIAELKAKLLELNN